MAEVHVQSGQWLVQLNESSAPIFRCVLHMVVNANGMDEWNRLNGVERLGVRLDSRNMVVEALGKLVKRTGLHSVASLFF